MKRPRRATKPMPRRQAFERARSALEAVFFLHGLSVPVIAHEIGVANSSLYRLCQDTHTGTREVWEALIEAINRATGRSYAVCDFVDAEGLRPRLNGTQQRYRIRKIRAERAAA